MPFTFSKTEAVAYVSTAIIASLIGYFLGFHKQKEQKLLQATSDEEIQNRFRKRKRKRKAATISDKENLFPDTQFIYIGGAKSAVGKSTIAAVIIHTFIKHKLFLKSDIAYIKPMTQCVSDTFVARYCLSHNIACVPIGPIVFKAGYTNKTIDGQTGTKAMRLNSITEAMTKLVYGGSGSDSGSDRTTTTKSAKKLVIIDGVGYISVGSVCHIDNIDVCQLFNAKLLLILKTGVGDSIDNSNLLLSYLHFKHFDFKANFLGFLYNSGGSADKVTRHSLEKCRKYVTKYFRDCDSDRNSNSNSNSHRNDNVRTANDTDDSVMKVVGFLPLFEFKQKNEKNCMLISNNATVSDLNQTAIANWTKLTEYEMQWIDAFSDVFQKNVDFVSMFVKIFPNPRLR